MATLFTREKFGINLVGDKELLRLFNTLPDKLQNRVMRGAVTKVARRMVKDMKAAVDTVGAVDTGALKKSIGFRVKTTRTGVIAVIGPRAAYRQAVTADKKGKLKAATKKRAATARQAGAKVTYRQPSRYAHLVELGTDHTRPKPFMRVGFRAGQDIGRATLRHDILAGIQREAAKLATGGRR